jgi:flagellar basal body-associated protein FliL
MSDEKKTPAAAPPASGGGGAGKILGLVLPALIAGAASFGGAKFASGHPAAAASSPEHAEAKAPGPTLPLDPFLLTVPDGNRKPHAMKVTIAVEFDPAAPAGHGEEGFKTLIPRIRDSALSYLRTLTYEEVLDPTVSDKMRTDLLEKAKSSGAPGAQRVLITDFVVQ